MTLRNNLEKYRKLAYLSQRQLAVLVNVSKQTIYDIERGAQRQIGYKENMLFEIFRILTVRVSKLNKIGQVFPGKKKPLN